MKALINLRSHTNWAKLYLKDKNPITLELNGNSLLSLYINRLIKIGFEDIDICLDDKMDISEINVDEYKDKLNIKIVNSIDIIDKDTFYGISAKCNYKVVIDGAVILPHANLLKREMKIKNLYLGEYKDNVGNTVVPLMTLFDYYKFLVKTSKRSKALRGKGTEVIETLVESGITIGENLILKNKILMKDRIVDPLNNFYIDIKDELIMVCQT